MIQTDLIFNTQAIHCATIGRARCHLNIDPGVHIRVQGGELQRVMHSERVLCAGSLSASMEFPDFAFVRAGFSAVLAL